jgi:hypothetical protein
MAQDAMGRDRGRVIALALDQLASAQKFKRGLDGAFREPGFLRQRAKAGLDRFPFRANGPAEEMEVNEIRSGLAIVTDDVAHENIEDVVVYGNGFTKTRHHESKKEEGKIKK